jgi:hypothetical protein
MEAEDTTDSGYPMGPSNNISIQNTQLNPASHRYFYLYIIK